MGTDASETLRAQAHRVADALVEVDLATELEARRSGDSYQAAATPAPRRSPSGWIPRLQTIHLWDRRTRCNDPAKGVATCARHDARQYHQSRPARAGWL